MSTLPPKPPTAPAPSAPPASSHGTVHRLPPGADPDWCRARLAPVTGAPPRVWRESVPHPSGSTAAAERRDRELGRPLGTAGPVLRATLLTYGDGVRDLVLVADPERVDRPDLHRVAAALTDGAPCATSASTPGGGGPRKGPGPTEFATTLTALHGHPRLADDVAALVALVLARILDGPAALDLVTPGGVVSTAVPPLEPTVTVSEFTAGHTVAAHAARAAGVPSTPGPEGDEDRDDEAHRVTVFVDPAPRPPSELRYRPPLSGRSALTLHVRPGPHGPVEVRGWLRGDAPLPEVDHLVSLLASASRVIAHGEPEQRVGDLPLLDDDATARTVASGTTAPTFPAPLATIPELVHAQAARSPDATAVSDGDTAVSYRELVERADAMAAGLRLLGVRPRTPVGVCLDRSAELVVTLLAVLSAGGTYVPLDPAYPRDRLDFLRRDTHLDLVVAESAVGPRALGRRTVTPGSLEADGRGTAAAGTAPGPGPDDPAYVIHTSGSTGRPKGVVVPHRNVVALIGATRDDLALSPEDVWTWFHSFAFDFSVWEIWGALATGGRLVVVPYLTCRSPEDFHRLLAREGVTVLSQTPSAFHRLVDRECAAPSLEDLRLVVLGGEALDAPRLIPWFDVRREAACRVVNMYGITETTVHVTSHTVTRGDALAGSRTVGRPLPGWGVRIVDRSRRVLPPGVRGEIAVTGHGLAHGYLGRPELSAQRFVHDPLDGTRMYLSGDLGLLREDGTVEHHGRVDDQVKVRGHRIEPGEVRHHVLAAGGVTDAAVLAVPDTEATDGALLTAFVVFGDGDPRTLRRHLARSLPEHLVPAVVAVEEIPLTPHGKVDERALARRGAVLSAPAGGPPPPQAPAAPAVPAATAESKGPERGAEQRLLTVWREVVAADAGAEDDFFDLGGNSLLALRLSRALRDQGLPVDVPTIYRMRTARALLHHLAEPSEGG